MGGRTSIHHGSSCPNRANTRQATLIAVLLEASFDLGPSNVPWTQSLQATVLVCNSSITRHTHLLVSAYRQAVVFSASCARCVFWVVCQEKVQDEVLVKDAGEHCTDSTSLSACVVGCHGAWQKEAQSLHHHNNLRGLRQHSPAHGVHQVGHPPCAGSLCITSEINHHQTTLARLQLFPRQPASIPSIGSSDRSPAYKQSFQVVLPTAVG